MFFSYLKSLWPEVHPLHNLARFFDRKFLDGFFSQMTFSMMTSKVISEAVFILHLTLTHNERQFQSIYQACMAFLDVTCLGNTGISNQQCCIYSCPWSVYIVSIRVILYKLARNISPTWSSHNAELYIFHQKKFFCLFVTKISKRFLKVLNKEST